MLTDEQVKKEKLERERQEAIVVTYTEGDYEFKIKGKDYKEVLIMLQKNILQQPICYQIILI